MWSKFGRTQLIGSCKWEKKERGLEEENDYRSMTIITKDGAVKTNHGIRKFMLSW